MKKIISILLIASLLLGALAVSAMATEDAGVAYVTIVDNENSIVLVNGEVPLADYDGDEAITINDALYMAHVMYGSEDNYASSLSDYGISLTKLWGVENGGSYGYYVNDGMAWSLGDKVKDGDYINAFIYKDLDTYSDKYAFFDAKVIDGVCEGESVELTLSYYDYDEAWNLVKTPLAGAMITVDGSETGAITDENGKATIEALAGTQLISATHDKMNIVSPLCVITGGLKDLALVYVTIVDDNNNPVMSDDAVTVADLNMDGLYSIDEALVCAHAQYYKDGKEGYESVNSEYGLFMTKLWGVANGGSYGYYLNNGMAWSLDDIVYDGDHIDAFIYKDTVGFSDSYTFFDETPECVVEGEEFSIKLVSYQYNPTTWDLEEIPLVGATIVIDGVETDILTDENGVATLTLTGGEHIITAKYEAGNIVTPVYKVNVAPEEVDNAPVVEEPKNPENPKTGDALSVIMIVISIMITTIACVIVKRKVND